MSGLISKKQKAGSADCQFRKEATAVKTAAVSVNIIDRARFCFGASSEDLFGVFGAVVRRDIGEA